MASGSSFRDVIANMYYNDLFDELSEYIEDNPDKLESNSYHVQSPDEAVLSDFDIITWCQPAAAIMATRFMPDPFTSFSPSLFWVCAFELSSMGFDDSPLRS